MATQILDYPSDSRSLAWGDLLLGPKKPYYPSKWKNRPSWDEIRSIDVVTVCDDPKHWKSLAARSMRGEKSAFAQLLAEFEVCLELFFARVLPDHDASIAVDQTLLAVANKLSTCDTKRPILPWLLAIARYRAAHPFEQRQAH